MNLLVQFSFKDHGQYNNRVGRTKLYVRKPEYNQVYHFVPLPNAHQSKAV